jgi:hypothetical protein
VAKATRLGELPLDKSRTSRLGVWREASSLAQEKPLAKIAQLRNAGQMILGRQRHIKGMKAQRKPMSKRPIGRPKMRWEDDVLEDVRSMDVRNWKEVAQNRDCWKKVVERAITLYRL